MGCDSCGAPTPRRLCRDCESLDLMEERVGDDTCYLYDCPVCGENRSVTPGEPCTDCQAATTATDGGER